MTHFHPCEQLKQPWTLKPLIAEVRDRGPNSKRTLLQRPLLEGDGESESRRKRGELGSPLSNLILLLLGSLSPLAGSWAQREGFFPSLRPSVLVYLFDFTPCRPKWPLPCIQNYFIPFCSEADSHREPWKGPLEEPGCVFSRHSQEAWASDSGRFAVAHVVGTSLGCKDSPHLHWRKGTNMWFGEPQRVLLWPFTVHWMQKYQQVNGTVCLKRENQL